MVCNSVHFNPNARKKKRKRKEKKVISTNTFLRKHIDRPKESKRKRKNNAKNATQFHREAQKRSALPLPYRFLLLHSTMAA